MKKLILVISTFPNHKICERIAEDLVKKRLAACCNYFSAESSYIWQEKLARSKEFMMFMKTTRENYPALESYLRKKHPYQLPEIIALEINRGEKKYLNWIMKGAKIG